MAESDEMRPIINEKAISDSYNDGGDPGSSRPHANLSILQAAFFVVANIVGIGIVILPSTTHSLGLFSALVMPLAAILYGYGGTVLSRSWYILQTRFPEVYRQRSVRNPYSTLGYETFGEIGRIVVMITLHVTVIFTVLVQLLIVADNVELLFTLAKIKVTICYSLPLLFILVTPCTWFGSPSDTWGMSAIAVAGSSIAVICLLVQLSVGGKQPTEHQPDASRNVLMSLSVICVAFFGHTDFLNVQDDMKEPKKFSSSLLIGFVCVLFLYTPPVLLSYYVYGGSITAINILDVLPATPLTVVINIMLTVHCFTAMVIFLNTFSLELEELLGVSDKFCWQRVILRTGCTFAVFFFALTFPHIESILHIGGSSLQPMISVVVPCILYIKVTSMFVEHSWKNYIVPSLIILFGLATILVSTYYAMHDFILELTLPCYLNMTLGS